MKRRTFLKFSLGAPLLLKTACRERPDIKINKKLTKSETANTIKYIEGGKNSFEYLEISGSYKEIGYQSGRHFKKNIESVIKDRGDWINKLIESGNSGSGKQYSDELLRVTRKNFPHLVEEVEGMADGAGVAFNAMWLMSIQSEISTFRQVHPGCSTVFYKDDKNSWLFHNEDGDRAYYCRMYVLRATPPSGVSFTTLVYPGMIPGVGPSFNDRGIVETTNYLGCKNPEPGIPRYFLGRAVLEAKSLDEALQIAEFMPRAFPWHHNLASIENNEYVSIETLPDGKVEKRTIGRGFYVHTNHITGEATKPYITEGLLKSAEESVSRYDALSSKIKEHNRELDNPDTIIGWLASHEKKPQAPCRHPKEGDSGQTLATVQIDIKNGSMRIYKGNPCLALQNGFYMDYKY